jgi:superfamily II DNA/RNA helicase
VFTRTRHGATKLSEQLNKAGIPAVDLHGMLSQSARARNLDKFSNGRSTTLVATDVAARGIHVDDVGLVIHADPPAEHKAYLHRSGRTARAGAKGTVVTLATGAQVKAVRQLTTKAKIKPTESHVQPGHVLLGTLAAEPIERTYSKPQSQTEKPEQRSRDGWARSKSSRPNRKPTGNRRQRPGSDRSRTPAKAS